LFSPKIGFYEGKSIVLRDSTMSDPLEDITELEGVRFVMEGGQVVKNELTLHQGVNGICAETN
jgi:hypothetical protein